MKEDYRLVSRVSSDELRRKVDELAQQINRDYSGQKVILVGILKGAFIFLADLARRLHFPWKWILSGYRVMETKAAPAEPFGSPRTSR